MGWNSFTEFTTKCFFGGDGKGGGGGGALQRSDLDMIFIAACTTGQS